MQVTKENWEKIFQAYVDVNGSHWNTAPFDIVKRMVDENGFYEFGVPGMGTWTSKLRVEKEGDVLTVRFLKNDELSGRMAAHLHQMHRRFLRALEGIAS